VVLHNVVRQWLLGYSHREIHVSLNLDRWAHGRPEFREKSGGAEDEEDARYRRGAASYRRVREYLRRGVLDIAQRPPAFRALFTALRPGTEPPGAVLMRGRRPQHRCDVARIEGARRWLRRPWRARPTWLGAPRRPS
jgi:hypothetical protein